MQKSFDGVKTWMAVNTLELNDNKTEAMIISSGRKSRSLSSSFPDSVTVGIACFHVWFTSSVMSVVDDVVTLYTGLQKRLRQFYLFLLYDYLSWPYFQLHLQQTHAVKSESIRSVAFAKSTWKIFQSTLQMVYIAICHCLVSTVILVKYLTSMCLYVSGRFASEGLVPGTALSPISSLNWSMNVG